MYKPLGRRTATVTDTVLTTARTGTGPHAAVVRERRRIMPYRLEALLVKVARLKFGCLEESAGIDLAFRAYTACSRCRTTDV